MNTRAAAVAAFVLLAGCGGGGGGNVAPTAPPPVQSPAGPTPSGSATLTLFVPRGGSSAKRAPHFVSPNATSLTVAVLTVDGAPPSATQVPPGQSPQTFPLSTAPGGNCTVSPGGETCTVTIPAPTGQVTYQFDLFGGTGNPKLATLTQTYTILPGSSPNLSAVLHGIVASVAIFTPGLTAGTSFSGPITVNAFDPSGALIVGAQTYQNPFTLTDNDTEGATSLTNNATTAATITVNSPNDVVILNYDGSAIDNFTITSNVPGVGASGSATVTVQNFAVTFPGTPNYTLKPTDPNYNQPTLTFTAIPQTLQFTAAQIGWSDRGTHGFTMVLDPASCGSGASAVVTVAPAAGTNNRTFNVTSKNQGVCKATVSGGPPGGPKTGVIWFSVTGATLILN